MSVPTEQQKRAIEATGGILLAAGAGTGKTATLVSRCVRLVAECGVDVDRLLVVTFTNAAAAEMRQRLREALRETALQRPDEPRFHRQVLLLESAHVSTIHSFCLELIRAHFAELQLDPGVAVLDESITAPLARHTAARIVTQAIETDRRMQTLAEAYCGSSGSRLGDLILRAHRFFVTQPMASDVLARELAFFAADAPNGWRLRREEITTAWWISAIPQALLQIPRTLDALREVRGYGGKSPTADGIRRLETVLPALDQRLRAWRPEARPPENLELLRYAAGLAGDDVWVRGTGKTRGHLVKLFEEAQLLLSWHPADGADPIDVEWALAREPMATLLELTRSFATAFTEAKRAAGGVDFADLEQLALQLLVDEESRPTAIAREWQSRLDHVFVDECQDINAAQHALIRALARDGEHSNLFMVGDVKQSIYRFRMAAPELFRSDAESWKDREHHQVLPLTENFRSRAGILAFANDLFAFLMSPRLEGVSYDAEDRLAFALPAQRAALSLTPDETQRPNGAWCDPDCRVELHLVLAGKSAAAQDPGENEGDGDGSSWGDLLDVERQAQVAASRLRQLMDGKHEVWDPRDRAFRALQWRDVGVLMRSVRGRTGSFVREFRRRGIPLAVEQGDFLETLEASDLTSLLRVLDNPRQDIPLFALLRSPLVGWPLDDLVALRPVHRGSGAWECLEETAGRHDADPRVKRFVEDLRRWRRLALMTSLTCVLETVLAESRYEAFLLALPDGPDRVANVRRFLELARRYDPLQRQGLFRFLRFLDEQADAGREIEPLPPRQIDAVQLLSVHKSKGLEFPVVILAGIGAGFPTQDSREALLLSRCWGVAPQIVDLPGRRRQDGLVLWQEKRDEKLASVAEELRLFYVGVTRARDTLILVGSFNPAGDAWESRTSLPPALGVPNARSYCDWLGLWIGTRADWSAGQGEVILATDSAPARLRWQTYANDSELGPVTKPDTNTAAPDAEPARAPVFDLDWQYPHAAATRIPSKTSASALRRLGSEPDEQAAPPWAPRHEFRPAINANPGSLSAAEIGTAHHSFLQNLDLTRCGTEAELRAEASRLLDHGLLGANETKVLDFGSLAAFWSSDLGLAIRNRAQDVRRELPFTAAFAPAELPPFAVPFGDGGGDDFVVVQGAVDLAVLLPDQIWVVDFKTDRVSEADLPAKALEHENQLRLYSTALERVYGRRTTRCALYFITRRRLWEVSKDPQGSGDPSRAHPSLVVRRLASGAAGF